MKISICGARTTPLWLLSLIALILSPCVSHAQSGLTDDAHTSSVSKEAGTNFGANPNLLLSPANNVYLRFKLTSTLPAGTPGSDVARATVKLYVSNVQAPGVFNVYQVAEGWSAPR